jgi:hypothetical protein
LRPFLLLALVGVLPGQVTYDQILHANRAPQNWLTYSGNYAGQRYSGLTALRRTNVANLGGTVASGPVSYAVNNRQYVAVCADSAMYVFGLPE